METKEFIEELNKTIDQVEEIIIEFEIKKDEIASAIYELIEEGS